MRPGRPARPASVASGTVSAVGARMLFAALGARGHDTAALCRRFELDPAVLADVDARVPVPLISRLWEEVPRLAGDEELGLHLAELAAAQRTASLGTALVESSATLGEGIRRLLRYERVFHDVRQSELHVDGGRAVISLRTRGDDYPVLRHAVEFAYAWLLLSSRRSTGAAIQPLDVAFEHPRPPRIAEHERLFGRAPRFDAPENVIALPREALDLPQRAADPALCELLESHARRLLAALPDPSSFAARVRALAAERLADGDATLEQVAARLRMSPRSVQRRLRDEGSSFHALLDGLRCDLARSYLTDPNVATAEVAFLLGFSDQSAFHRAFLRWTGETPGEHRRRAR